MTVDTRPYLDAPFVDGGRDLAAGVDCWGLVRAVARREFGLDLPAYAGAGLDDAGRVNALRLARATRDRVPEFDAVADPQPGDVVLLSPSNRPVHVGIVIATRPLTMLHAERGVGVAAERVYGPVWRHRVAGFYRYRA